MRGPSRRRDNRPMAWGPWAGKCFTVASVCVRLGRRSGVASLLRTCGSACDSRTTHHLDRLKIPTERSVERIRDSGSNPAALLQGLSFPPNDREPTMKCLGNPLSRRGFLTVGAVGGLGLTLADLLTLEAHAEQRRSRRGDRGQKASFISTCPAASPTRNRSIPSRSRRSNIAANWAS